MNCQHKAEAGKPLAQINGNTDTANVAWEQNSNSSLFCWIWDASKIQIFCTSCTLEKKRANLFFSPLITSTSGAVRTQERGAAQLPGFILLSEPPSSIFCQRSQPEREQAQRNGVVASSQKLPVVFIFCIDFSGYSTGPPLARMLPWRTFSRCFFEHRWTVEKSNQQCSRQREWLWSYPWNGWCLASLSQQLSWIP